MKTKEECVAEIVESAKEMLPDFPSLIDDYSGFARCMWVVDSHMEDCGMDREQYEDAMREAYSRLGGH
jgi:hypothetical protein